ncbi:hypothetical protein H4582DRAFT_257774 [Lactarius indigo]|nr:hypothetical protein H4582DRAFT_1583494 [Lactarius indigo]KAI9438369.1 hypothetical protein H4582DRAFT_257774 [Lactarius indigo]
MMFRGVVRILCDSLVTVLLVCRRCVSHRERVNTNSHANSLSRRAVHQEQYRYGRRVLLIIVSYTRFYGSEMPEHPVSPGQLSFRYYMPGPCTVGKAALRFGAL